MVDPIQPTGRGEAPGGAGEAARTARSDVRFEDVLRQSIQDVNELQSAADRQIEDLSLDRVESVAEVMTAVEKADIAFRTLMQVRNKLVEAYEELLRIRV